MKEGDHLGDLDIDIIIIFKWILSKQEGRVWTEAVWLTIARL